MNPFTSPTEDAGNRPPMVFIQVVNVFPPVEREALPQRKPRRTAVHPTTQKAIQKFKTAEQLCKDEEERKLRQWLPGEMKPLGLEGNPAAYLVEAAVDFILNDRRNKTPFRMKTCYRDSFGGRQQDGNGKLRKKRHAEVDAKIQPHGFTFDSYIRFLKEQWQANT